MLMPRKGKTRKRGSTRRQGTRSKSDLTQQSMSIEPYAQTILLQPTTFRPLSPEQLGALAENPYARGVVSSYIEGVSTSGESETEEGFGYKSDVSPEAEAVVLRWGEGVWERVEPEPQAGQPQPPADESPQLVGIVGFPIKPRQPRTAPKLETNALDDDLVSELIEKVTDEILSAGDPPESPDDPDAAPEKPDRRGEKAEVPADKRKLLLRSIHAAVEDTRPSEGAQATRLSDDRLWALILLNTIARLPPSAAFSSAKEGGPTPARIAKQEEPTPHRSATARIALLTSVLGLLSAGGNLAATVVASADPAPRGSQIVLVPTGPQRGAGQPPSAERGFIEDPEARRAALVKALGDLVQNVPTARLAALGRPVIGPVTSARRNALIGKLVNILEP